MRRETATTSNCNLSFKFKRLIDRLKQPEWRRYACVLLLAKMVALFVLVSVFAIVSSLVGTPAHAQGASATTTTLVSAVNTGWTLLAAFLVFAMQVGFMMLEAGFCRVRETVNVLMECIVDTCLCGLLFWAIGYAFMFSSGNGIIGTNWFFLNGAPEVYGSTGVALLAHWVFQFAFADTCSTITSGSMVGRTSFKGDLFYSVAVSGFIYPIAGHWTWGPDGFLAKMADKGHFLSGIGNGFHDFAGSTVVHTIGGAIAFAGAIVLKPRLGCIVKNDGKERLVPTVPHDLTLVAVGGLILWFGWYGFNPGSTLSLMDFQGVGRVATNTTLAACAGGLVAMLFAYFWRCKTWDIGYTINGFLGGLVAITCPCYWVLPGDSILIGAIAGIVAVLGYNLLRIIRVDDPIGAVPVHLFCGIWGTWSLGIFACGRFGAPTANGTDTSAGTILTGLRYHGGVDLLCSQFIGSIVTGVTVFVVSFLVMLGLNALPTPWRLRISKAGEELTDGKGGIDVTEHGTRSYDYND